MAIEVFAPAKVNLTLHVTGQRSDGYHLLDSLVVFADVGDVVRVAKASETQLTVIGPMSAGVPDDPRNLCWKAAELFGEPVSIELEKHLPAAAGIGGGSSDAAAVLRAMEGLFERPFDRDAVQLGADVPVCMAGQTSRMSGIGDIVAPVQAPKLAAVLVNPGVHVPTPEVFARLSNKENAPIAPLPPTEGFMDWLAQQRNDLEVPAIACAPVISDVLDHLRRDAILARMSGSGATCFAIYADLEAADQAAKAYQAQHPDHWVRACTLG